MFVTSQCKTTMFVILIIYDSKEKYLCALENIFKKQNLLTTRHGSKPR